VPDVTRWELGATVNSLPAYNALSLIRSCVNGVWPEFGRWAGVHDGMVDFEHIYGRGRGGS
jgi:hypothetical protein